MLDILDGEVEEEDVSLDDFPEDEPQPDSDSGAELGAADANASNVPNENGGYERLVGKLEQLGANVRRVSEDTRIEVGAPAASAAVV